VVDVEVLPEGDELVVGVIDLEAVLVLGDVDGLLPLAAF